MKRPELCGCDEAMLYHAVLLDVEVWLTELGAEDPRLAGTGPMNGDDGARSMLLNVRAALRARRKVAGR